MADLVKYRERFLVRPQTCVEVRVTFVPVDEAQDSPGLTPWYQCVTCGDALAWQADPKFWECPGCGYQLTADEATALCDMAIESVSRLRAVTKKKRGFLWRLSRLFVGKARQMSASST